MRKLLKIILIIVISIIIIQLFIYFIKDNHSINYIVTSNGNNFSIKEVFKNNKYQFNIVLNDNFFTLYYDNSFYKSKKIIEEIYFASEKDIICIFPVLKYNRYSSITCSKNKQNYSYYMLKDNVIVQNFIKELENKGYNPLKYNDNSTSKKIGYSRVFSNIDKDTYMYVWKYNGFYSINKSKTEEINLFAEDSYSNNLGILMDKYYLIPNYDDKYRYKSFLIIDITTNKKKILTLKEEISRDSYYMGVVDNKIYLFDKDYLKQYEIDVIKNSIKEVGNIDNNVLYYDNGKWIRKNVYSFKEEMYFTYNRIELENNNNQLLYGDNYIYYLDEDYNFYSYDNNYQVKTLLFNMGYVSNIQVVKDDIYFIKDDTIYTYNERGIFKIIQYSELKYNSKTSYVVYKK